MIGSAWTMGSLCCAVGLHKWHRIPPDEENPLGWRYCIRYPCRETRFDKAEKTA